MGAQVKGEIEMDQLIDCVCIPCITDIYFSLFARHSIWDNLTFLLLFYSENILSSMKTKLQSMNGNKLAQQARDYVKAAGNSEKFKCEKL